MEYHTITERYVENLDLPESVKTNLMGRLDLQLQTLSEKVQDALSISADQMQKCVFQLGKTDTSAGKTDTSAGQAMEWKQCEGTCKTLITDAVNQEIGSTAFMLKLLADSVIRPDGKPHRLKFGLDPSFYKREVPPGASCHLLTGRWKEDAPFLRLVLPPSSSPNGRLTEGPRPSGRLTKGPRPSGRLIMGFGPSASGKTHWAKTILGLLAEADDTFPEVFFAVDGGLVRESSAVYQFATEMAHCAGFAGFKNLHAGMFVTGDIKHTMEKYLLQESKRSTSSAISLYVPETLAKCEYKGMAIPHAGKIPYGSFVGPCMEYLQPFLEITRDNYWIGLLIWQHATAEAHDADTAFMKDYPGMACVGCEASGRKRETGEGKPYDGKAYDQAMKNGRKYMELAPGGRYEIHNSGRPGGMSVMIDRSVRSKVALGESFQSAVIGRFSEIMENPKVSEDKHHILYIKNQETRPQKVAERNAAAAASAWKNMQASSEMLEEASSNVIENPKSNEDRQKATKLKKAIWNETIRYNPVAFPMQQQARRAAASATGSVLRNVANKVYASRNRTRNANPNAIKFREASTSLNARKQAEAAAANAFYEKQKATGFGPAPTEPLSEAEQSVYRKELNRTQAINAEQNKKREAYLNKKRREALGLHGVG